MNFQEITKELIAGKKVRRSCWEAGHYWEMKNSQIKNSMGETPTINAHQLQAVDWESNKEEFCLSNKIRCLGCGKPKDECESEFYYQGDTIRVKDIKEFIKLLKEELKKEYWSRNGIDKAAYWIGFKIDKLAGDKLNGI